MPRVDLTAPTSPAGELSFGANAENAAWLRDERRLRRELIGVRLTATRSRRPRKAAATRLWLRRGSRGATEELPRGYRGATEELPRSVVCFVDARRISAIPSGSG